MSRSLALFLSLCFIFATASAPAEDAALKIATFEADASPPIGSPLWYDRTSEVQMPLTARGIVILSDQKPIVLCAVDWIGIANGGYTEWREELAKAAETSVQRVAVHTLHQHDAPGCDFTMEDVLAAYGLDGKKSDAQFARRTIAHTAAAIRQAIKDPQPVTHMGLGKGKVEKVASNRRVIGQDGKIKFWRGSTTRDSAARAEPEGTIDPFVWSISFFNGEQPLVVLDYYATHPMSYYRTGKANPDFVGIARQMRERSTGVPHIYFTGAGGNVAAGKYNDGSHENRQIFAERLAAGMEAAWKSTEKQPMTSADLGWRVAPVALPAASHLEADQLQQTLADQQATEGDRIAAARDLIWLQRCTDGDQTDLTCLELGNARVLHLPGELFVEYQLAAQKMRPDLFVAAAAYGEYAPGYIGLKRSYPQGGYEVSARASRVAPDVEDVLMSAIERLFSE